LNLKSLIRCQSKIANQKSKIRYGSTIAAGKEAENQRLPEAFAPDARDAENVENRAG
jgi:hypothetical protein